MASFINLHKEGQEMAFMVPETIPLLATAGERLLFETLKEYLPSDYVIYYKPYTTGTRPDFVIIGPDLGCVVLQTYDYTISSILNADRHEWTVQTAGGKEGLAAVVNPLKQAREHASFLEKELKDTKALAYQDGPHTGQLKFSCGSGTVFPRMKQDDFARNRLYSSIGREFVLCREEFDPEDKLFTVDNLIVKIHGMFTSWTHRWHILSMEELNGIRSLLQPGLRTGPGVKQSVHHQDQWLLSRHSGIALDLRQENIAYHLGDKHRLIRGATGSGKTLVLASRTKVLAKMHPDWKILVLCYGLSLSGYLQQLIGRMMSEPDDLFDLMEMADGGKLEAGSRVEVYNFRQWLRNELHTKEEEIPSLLAKLVKKEAILPVYDAIMIDEGQDFEPEWLKLLGHVLNPDTQSLLIAEDCNQSITGSKRRSSLARDTGLSFRGRSKILTVNYRNTAEIVRFAWNFYHRHTVMKHQVQLGTAKYPDAVPLPSSITRRSGPAPIVKSFGGLQKEMHYVAERIAALHGERNVPFSDMLILYRVKDRYDMSYVDLICRRMKEDCIPFTLLSERSRSERNGSTIETDGEAVVVSTLDEISGLDYRAVFIVNIESMPYPLEPREEREVSLLYVGMTRALDWLYLTYSGESKFTQYLAEAAQAWSGAEEARIGYAADM
jgi:hypothetical protein